MDIINKHFCIIGAISNKWQELARRMVLYFATAIILTLLSCSKMVEKSAIRSVFATRIHENAFAAPPGLHSRLRWEGSSPSSPVCGGKHPSHFPPLLNFQRLWLLGSRHLDTLSRYSLLKVGSCVSHTHSIRRSNSFHMDFFMDIQSAQSYGCLTRNGLSGRYTPVQHVFTSSRITWNQVRYLKCISLMVPQSQSPSAHASVPAGGVPPAGTDTA